MKAILTHNNHGSEPDITLDKEDTWSLDHTFALLAVPLLRQLRETTHGAPTVDLEDVPSELRGYSGNIYAPTDVFFERWDWVLAEMIWAFETIAADRDEDFGNKEVWERVDNGTRLFGKYFRNLWD